MRYFKSDLVRLKCQSKRFIATTGGYNMAARMREVLAIPPEFGNKLYLLPS